MSALDRDAAREALFNANPADWEPSDRWIEELLDALERCVRPVPPQTDYEYGWTARQWRDWSLKLSSMMSNEWDGDEDELSIIEDFVRHFSEHPRYRDESVPPQTLNRADLIDHIRYTVWDESEAVATADEVADGIIARLVPDPRFDAIRALHVQEDLWCKADSQRWPCSTVCALDGDA